MDNENLPNNDLELTPSKSRPWYKRKAIVIPLALLILIVGAASSEESEESGSNSGNSATESSSTTPTAAPPVEIEPAGGEFGNYPSAQKKFVKVIEEARDVIDAAETDLQESVALRGRDKQLCALLTGNRAVDWTGIIKNIGANGEGKAYVDIEIAERVQIKTWNNAFSDIRDDTLIPPSSKFFDDLVAMTKGDLVTFSATLLKSSNSCLKKGNLTEFFYGKNPEFIVKFSDISKN